MSDVIIEIIEMVIIGFIFIVVMCGVVTPMFFLIAFIANSNNKYVKAFGVFLLIAIISFFTGFTILA